MLVSSSEVFSQNPPPLNSILYSLQNTDTIRTKIINLQYCLSLAVKKKKINKKQQVSINQELVQSEPNYSNELGADRTVT